MEFSIQWAADATRKSSQFLGGREELRGFIDAGDTEGWAHYVVHSGVNGDVEFALGETRWDTGERIGTFLAVANSTSRAGCAGTWWRAHPLWPSRLSDDGSATFELVDPELIGGTEEEPRLSARPANGVAP